MAVSMTGYGKSVLENESVSIKVEIKSVNSRYLDINYKSSRGLSFMEEKIRNMVKAAITRGKVDIYIGMRGNAGISKSVSIDENLASTYKEALIKLKLKLGLKGKAALSDFTGVPGILSIEENDPEEDEISPLVVAAFNYALEKIVDMKSTEGRALEKDMLIKVNEMDEIVNGIEKSADGLTEAYRDKLSARVKELMNGADVDESKIAQEVAFFADRSSIDEEITRLRSHIKQFGENIAKRTVGRKLDFIIQEMNREANTIGSKSASLELTNYALELKSIIEKLREQAQNIE
jgi:uncharacterized protein (TIGR00255 family)